MSVEYYIYGALCIYQDITYMEHFAYVSRILHIDGNASKPHISISDENEFLIPISIKCQWLVLKFECKVYNK